MLFIYAMQSIQAEKTEFDNPMIIWYDRENDNFARPSTSHDTVKLSDVTEEESDALTYAFITFLKRQLEYEYKP